MVLILLKLIEPHENEPIRRPDAADSASRAGTWPRIFGSRHHVRTIVRQKNITIPFFKYCMMKPIVIAPGSAPEHLTALALSVHNVVGGMPVAVKARDRPGVLVAGGSVKQVRYESKALDSVFDGSPAKKTTAGGDYGDIPMYVSAICDMAGHAVAAIGVIDTAGVLSLKEFAEISALLARQSGRSGPPVK
jgi:hypothetical protein